VRASRTVHEVRVFHITASDGKREYIYSMPGLGESLLALRKVHTPLYNSPSPLSHSLGSVVAFFVRLRASSALHQGFDLCGTRESSSK
jgi:hypothetical protein